MSSLIEHERSMETSYAYGHAVGCMEVVAAALKYDDKYLRECVGRMVQAVRDKQIELNKTHEHQRTLVHTEREALPHATD